MSVSRTSRKSGCFKILLGFSHVDRHRLFSPVMLGALFCCVFLNHSSVPISNRLLSVGLLRGIAVLSNSARLPKSLISSMFQNSAAFLLFLGLIYS